MLGSFMEAVRDTLHGQLRERYRIPGVVNAFAEGSVCSKAYEEMYAAYSRLCTRLGVIDEDDDVEIIINSLMTIEEEIAYYMYRYGAMFGIRDSDLYTPQTVCGSWIDLDDHNQ